MKSSVFQNETPQKILLKIKKVKALAEGGIDSEKKRLNVYLKHFVLNTGLRLRN